MADTEINFGEFQRQRMRRKWRTRLAVFLAASYVAGLFMMWLIFRSPVFRVDAISIRGNERIGEEEIRDIMSVAFGSRAGLRRVFSSRNILGWPSVIAPDILQFIPAVQAITLEKDYGARTLNVTVHEHTPFGIWCKVRDGVRSPCFWFDEEGVAFEPSVAAEGSLISVVNDYSESEIMVGTRVLPDQFIPALFSIFTTVRGIGMGIREIGLYDAALQELAVKTYNGPEFYFSLRFPVPHALSALEKLFSERNPASYDYFDFRVENRIYYK